MASTSFHLILPSWDCQHCHHCHDYTSCSKLASRACHMHEELEEVQKSVTTGLQDSTRMSVPKSRRSQFRNTQHCHVLTPYSELAIWINLAEHDLALLITGSPEVHHTGLLWSTVLTIVTSVTFVILYAAGNLETDGWGLGALPR